MKKYDNKQHPRDAEDRFENKASAQGGAKSSMSKSSHKNSSMDRPRDAEGRFTKK